MIYVLDSSAMIALLRDEDGADMVESALTDSANTCFAHAINLCEVYYDAVREKGDEAGLSVIQDLYSAGVSPREDMDAGFWQVAGRFKAAQRRVSLADCFCVALTLRVGGELLTGDHHEFDRIVPLGLCPIRFIR
jgi:PIN domain nuclease of toxin-antitoxin system